MVSDRDSADEVAALMVSVRTLVKRGTGLGDTAVTMGEAANSVKLWAVSNALRHHVRPTAGHRTVNVPLATASSLTRALDD